MLLPLAETAAATREWRCCYIRHVLKMLKRVLFTRLCDDAKTARSFDVYLAGNVGHGTLDGLFRSLVLMDYDP